MATDMRWASNVVVKLSQKQRAMHRLGIAYTKMSDAYEKQAPFEENIQIGLMKCAVLIGRGKVDKYL